MTAILHPDIARLSAIEGTRDLSAPEVAEVFQVSTGTVQRICNSGDLESTRHRGRGRTSKKALRISRAAIVRYLVKVTTGDRAVLMAAIAQDLPQFQAIAASAATPEPALTPAR